ncbi:peptidylprolyl isomerase [Planctomycetota bacterium]|nr:peptidylprolyl isomerase [Planctomycetota bacterium]
MKNSPHYRTSIISKGFIAFVALLIPLIGCSSSGPNPVEGRQLRGGAAGENTGNRVLARVGRQEISSADLRSRILARYYGPRALNGLIREALFVTEAERLGLRLDPEEVSQQVESKLDSILGSTSESRRRSLLKLRRTGLGEMDLRKELVSEVSQALLIQKVVSARRQVLEDQILDRWRSTWKERRRRVEHLAFPLGDLNEDEIPLHEDWVKRTGRLLERGVPMQEVQERPPGLRASFAPISGEAWMRESELAGHPLFFKVFEVDSGEVLGPILEENYGWHLFRVVEERRSRPYSDVREELKTEILSLPPSDAEILAVEESIRMRIPVSVEKSAFPWQ